MEKTDVLGGKSCPSVSLSATNPVLAEMGSNSDLRGEVEATDRLRHGTTMNCS